MGSSPMRDLLDSFITRQNLANFTDQLQAEADPGRRAVLLRLLVDEEDKLGHGLEQLDIINERIAAGHSFIARQQVRVSELAHDGHAGKVARDVLGTFLQAQALLEHHRDKILNNLHRGVL
jgi:hypothetical protein